MPQPLIAIVDDDESMRRALATLLRSAGYRTNAHGSARALLLSRDYESARCVVSDIQMPDMTGLELARALDDCGCRVPVILITARTEAELEDDARASGAFCLLHKPFQSAELIACIERALAGI